MELYNKYRPSTYEDVLGNDIACKSVMQEIKNGTHCFLFTGPAGTGKTTLARIVARDAGATDMTIHELNSSENRGIDTSREVMDELRYAPVEGTKVVYIFDEAHMMTTAAQNSFLKMFEECPEHAILILCTTNPEKLIKPLLTRCSRIEMKPLDDTTMFMLLRKVAHKEGVSINPDILKKAAALAEGSSRKGLKILSSILYLENDDLRKEFLEKNTVTDESEDVIELCRALIKNAGWSAYMECMEKCKDDIDNSPESVRQLVMSYSTSVLKKGMNINAAAMLQAFSNCDTYRNGKYALYVALLDFISLLSN